MVWKLDRLGQPQIDTDDRTPFGKFILTMFAAFAELERSFIVERTQVGFKSYRAALSPGELTTLGTASRGRLCRWVAHQRCSTGTRSPSWHGAVPPFGRLPVPRARTKPSTRVSESREIAPNSCPKNGTPDSVES